MRALLLVLALPLAAIAAEPGQNAAPFMVVGTPGVTTGALSLQGTRIEARVDGVFADVTVTQRYANRSELPLEAVYIVPAAPGVAMHKFEVLIGDRLLKAEIERKREAREKFVAARKEGKKASLLEQYGDEAFRMSIANIGPGESVLVQLRYSQILMPEGGRHRLAFAPPVDARYHDERIKVALRTGALQVRIDYDTPVPLHSLDAGNATVTRSGPGAVRVEYAGPAVPFVAHWSLRGAALADGLLTGSDATGHYFMIQVQPPQAVVEAMVLPREYLFVVDRASLGYGFHVEAYRYLMAQLLGALRPVDRFNIVAFDDVARAFMPESRHAGPAAIAEAAAWLDKLRPKGHERKGFDAALDLALAKPRLTGTARTVVLVSDGQVGVAGARFDGARFDAIAARFADANLVPFGVGWGIDVDRLEALARHDGTDAVLMIDASRADQEVRRLRAWYSMPLLSGVTIAGEGVTLEGVTPIADLFGERPLVVLGRYEGEGRIVVNGESAAGPWRREFTVGAAAPDARGAMLARAWARQRIGGLLDYLRAEERAAWITEVTELGLRHSVATPYTSFVAVEEKVEPVAPKPADDLSFPDTAAPAAMMASTAAGFLSNPFTVEASDGGATPIAVARAMPPPRMAPLVVVLLDRGRRDDPFFAGAARYYARRGALMVRDVGSLAGLADALRRVAADLGGPLGEVRVVTHSSPWSGLATALVDDGPTLDGEGLARALRVRPFAALDESVLDAASHIQVEGCGLGRRADLLEDLARLLGGDDAARPSISAPDAFVAFVDGGARREELAYRARVAPGRGPADAADRVYPVRVTVLAPDPAELRRAGARRWIAGQSALRERLARLGLTVGDLAWRIEDGDAVGEGRALIEFAR